MIDTIARGRESGRVQRAQEHRGAFFKELALIGRPVSKAMGVGGSAASHGVVDGWVAMTPCASPGRRAGAGERDPSCVGDRQALPMGAHRARGSWIQAAPCSLLRVCERIDEAMPGLRGRHEGPETPRTSRATHHSGEIGSGLPRRTPSLHVMIRQRGHTATVVATLANQKAMQNVERSRSRLTRTFVGAPVVGDGAGRLA